MAAAATTSFSISSLYLSFFGERRKKVPIARSHAMSANTGKGSDGRRSKGSIDGVSTQILAATALAFFAMLAMTAIEGRGRSGLPDILVDVKLGGKMKINTSNGPSFYF